mgnify:CR=1 FL=1
MEKTNNLKERLNGLFKEMEEIKALLEAEDAEEASEEVSEVLENEPIEDENEVLNETEEVDEETGEEAEIETTEEEPEPVADEQQEEEQEPVSEEEVETPEDNAEEEPAMDEEKVVEEPAVQTMSDIPTMHKQGEETATNVTDDETGEELPVDFEQIIEAQQAKITALQAENSKLKTKVEGAFGYSAKPAGSVKVNKLYDDALDLSFHK